MPVQEMRNKKGEIQRRYTNSYGGQVYTYFDKDGQEKTKSNKFLATLGGLAGYTIGGNIPIPYKIKGVNYVGTNISNEKRQN